MTGENDRLRGTFFGDASTPFTVRIDLDIDQERVSCDISPISEASDEPPLSSKHRAVRYYVGQLTDRVRRQAARNRPPRAVPKPAAKSRGKKSVEAVICPSCMGYRSFDCDRCDGAGVVRRN
jgi:hypothetical protein